MSKPPTQAESDALFDHVDTDLWSQALAAEVAELASDHVLAKTETAQRGGR